MLPSAFVMGADYSFFDYPVRVLLFIPVVMGLRTKADPLLVSRGFFLGGSFGCLGGAFFSAYMLFFNPGFRVGLPITNPIPFGQIAAMLSVIAFVSIFHCSRRWEKLVSILGFFGGVFSIFASGSFGAFLGCGFGLLISSFIVFKICFSKSACRAIGFLLLASACLIVPSAVVRVQNFFFELDAYSAGSGMATSLGARLILWGISVREIVQSPWFGIGPGNFMSVLNQFCSVNQCTDDFSGFNHVHSQYFDSALNAGLIGLSGLLVSLVSPAVLFYRQIAVTGGSAQGAAIVGLAVVLAAMGSMVSQPLYAHNISVISYVLTISVCWFLAVPASRQV
jgi:O-antigen ligase